MVPLKNKTFKTFQVEHPDMFEFMKIFLVVVIGTLLVIIFAIILAFIAASTYNVLFLLSLWAVLYIINRTIT